MWFINIQYLHMQCLQRYILYICAIKEQYIFINQFDNSVFITHNLISTVPYGICYCDTAMSVTACAWSVENLQGGARIMYRFGSDVLMHMCLFAQTHAWTSFSNSKSWQSKVTLDNICNSNFALLASVFLCHPEFDNFNYWMTIFLMLISVAVSIEIASRFEACFGWFQVLWFNLLEGVVVQKCCYCLHFVDSSGSFPRWESAARRRSLRPGCGCCSPETRDRAPELEHPPPETELWGAMATWHLL